MPLHIQSNVIINYPPVKDLILLEVIMQRDYSNYSRRESTRFYWVFELVGVGLDAKPVRFRADV